MRLATWPRLAVRRHTASLRSAFVSASWAAQLAAVTVAQVSTDQAGDQVGEFDVGLDGRSSEVAPGAWVDVDADESVFTLVAHASQFKTCNMESQVPFGAAWLEQLTRGKP